jgi:hypothetical protein
MIDRDVAERVKSVSLACTYQLDQSVKEALSRAPAVHASLYRRLVGRVLGELFTAVLMPIYAAYPDLEPEELKRARLDPQPATMSPEVGSKLMDVISFATQELSTLRAELSADPGKDVSDLNLALQEPLNALQDIREFLHRVCPEIKET